jgi:arylformamidase
MIYDVSVPIRNDMPVWPSDPPVKLTPSVVPSRDGSHMIRITSIDMGSHTGTHIDAPCHFVDGGKTLHEISMDALVGEATVFELPGVTSITRGALERFNWSGVQRALFKTDNSAKWADAGFHKDFVSLEPSAATFLVERSIRLAGIDYLSIDPYGSNDHPSHFILLGHNVVVLEGLDLRKVAPGRYHMVALPLNLQGADGAPTRVILMDED